MKIYDDNYIEYFTHNIFFLRQKYNLTKKQMAMILGIGMSSLNKLEQGILPP